MGKDRRIKNHFDPANLLTGDGDGQSRERSAPGQILYTEGSAGDAIFYVREGWVKIATVSRGGKEAVVGFRREGEFFGTLCLVGKRFATATALTHCSLIRISRRALIRLLREQPDFAVMFTTYLVQRNVRDQETLVDHMTNPAEKRLARALLLLANHSDGSEPLLIAAPFSQGMLASMIGTTRPRVSLFMNRFKKHGYIEYDGHGRVWVHNSLQQVLSDR